MIGVYVLADQRHLADAGVSQPLDLGDDFLHRPRNFDATRVRHDTERAELVAPFLHGDERRNTAFGDYLPLGLGQDLKLVLDRKFSVDTLFATPRTRNHFGQAMIVLRADDKIYRARAADDLLAFGLRHAAGDCDHHAAPVARGSLLHFADAADLGIDLIDRLFPDMTGVEDDEIGVLRTCGLGEPLGCQRVRHTMRIVDVHLAAKGLDVDFAGFAHAVFGCGPI